MPRLIGQGFTPRLNHIEMASTKRVALQPRHPERICWGCDKYCAADELASVPGDFRAAPRSDDGANLRASGRLRVIPLAADEAAIADVLRDQGPELEADTE